MVALEFVMVPQVAVGGGGCAARTTIPHVCDALFGVGVA